ncbi:MAG: phycobiliprotein lyase [Hormoscilla sp. GUM202]|nr:phycobiliprotein lyase [Hormoscilla sp. GUM202]
MDITEFFQLSAGKWFSQRTVHHLASTDLEIGKSNLVIDFLPQTDPDLSKLCQKYQIDPGLALCGTRVTWDGTIGQQAKKHSGATVLVAVADGGSRTSGKLLRSGNSPDQDLGTGRYLMGSDQVLTLTISSETAHIEERLWFASDNLRFRTSTSIPASGFHVTSFCSEIRMGVTTPQPAEATSAQR